MTKLSKIVFFGSGPVAAATLATLWPHFEFEAIITKPRAEGHHGSVPVLEFAQAHHAQVHTPRTKNELNELFESATFRSPAGLVVDYGIIISNDVIHSFAKGIINSHFSLLPQWRGADPITFSVLSGQGVSGVSLMLINERLDEGQLIAQERFTMPSDITTPKLTDELVALSNKLLIDTVPKYLAGDIKPYDQPTDIPVSHSRKLTKTDATIDTNKPAAQIEREIRAYSGWPKSSLQLFGHQVIIKKARVAQYLDDGALVITCGHGTFLEILQLTAPSGRTMNGADFMRGYNKK